MATSGVGCMASVYIHIGNANIHIGNVNIRIGSHVRTHRATRTYALVNTYVRIEQHVRTHWSTRTYAVCNTDVRIEQHVRTHWSTRTYALSNTDVRIGLYIYMYRVRLRHILHQDLIRLPPPVFAGVQNFGWKPKVQKRGCVKTEMVYLFVKMIALSTFWHTL